MKFGVTVSRFDEIDLAVEAERSGYDFCWVWRVRNFQNVPPHQGSGAGIAINVGEWVSG